MQSGASCNRRLNRGECPVDRIKPLLSSEALEESFAAIFDQVPQAKIVVASKSVRQCKFTKVRVAETKTVRELMKELGAACGYVEITRREKLDGKPLMLYHHFTNSTVFDDAARKALTSSNVTPSDVPAGHTLGSKKSLAKYKKTNGVGA
jgi:hypothetical protein